VWQDLLSSGTAQTASEGPHRQETHKMKSVKVHSQLDLHNSVLEQNVKYGIFPAEFN
jgi:hypothetical protein